MRVRACTRAHVCASFQTSIRLLPHFTPNEFPGRSFQGGCENAPPWVNLEITTGTNHRAKLRGHHLRVNACGNWHSRPRTVNSQPNQRALSMAESGLPQPRVPRASLTSVLLPSTFTLTPRAPRHTDFGDNQISVLFLLDVYGLVQVIQAPKTSVSSCTRPGWGWGVRE